MIIPCYNVERYIDRCLTSIISQTIEIENLQVILVDDASTDHTWEHLMVWEQRYSQNIIFNPSRSKQKARSSKKCWVLLCFCGLDRFC